MRKLKLICLLSIFSVSLFAQKKSLDDSIYDQWQSIGDFLISEDANVSFTQYKSYAHKSTLVIKVYDSGFEKIIKGASSPKFFDNQQLAYFTAKDTLYLMDVKNESIKVISGVSKPKTHEESKYITYFKDESYYILDAQSFLKGQEVADSISNVKKSSFLNSTNLLILASDSIETSFVLVNMESKNSMEKDTIYNSQKVIRDFDFNEEGKRIIFYSTTDSIGVDGVEIELLVRKGKKFKRGQQLYEHSIAQLNESYLTDSLKFNVKKGITFSEDGSYYEFVISPLAEIVKSKKRGAKGLKAKSKVKKPEFEYELWRWNDTLLPIQKRPSTVYANNFYCIFRPKENKFIQLSHGRGIYLRINDSSPYGFELDKSPYLYETLWKDPVPKDYYYTNIKTGEFKLLYKAYNGSFTPFGNSPYLFTYEDSSEDWSIINLDTEEKINLTEAVPTSFKKEDFDKPQPAGSYGQSGLSADKKFFIINDKYDVWAVPINGNAKDAYCITNGYGRKHNIEFRIFKISKGKSKVRGRGKSSSDEVDLKEDIILESVNLDNMHAGYYRVSKGKDPVKLIEGPYKFSVEKHLNSGYYVVKRESFNEAPDYWLANKDFKFIRRITSLNDQLKEYKVGDSKVISWKDNSGQKQTGILYTPENYDSTKAYPTIVYFYETMSQDAFLFYEPAPSTSTINPIMFVSRGYVIFMPDIKYEIGWPGKSCLNIVESGTRHLIDRGVIDPNRLGLQGHSWGGYQVAYLITQTDLFTAACSETAVANMTSAYTGIRKGPGKPRMFMYECTQSRIGGTLWEKKKNYIENSPLFYLDQVTTPLLSRHSDGDEAVPYSQGLELFIALKRLRKEVWMFNYKGDGHNIKKRGISLDWTKRMDEYFDYYLMGAPKPKWMILE